MNAGAIGPRVLAVAFAAAPLALLAGCSQRVIQVTSEPTGALVTINDVPVGRTPLQTEFTYYGDYDVQVRKDGFEPIRTKATAWTPIYERPPLDLASAPFPYETVVKWHFKLEPSLEKTEPKQQFEEGLITRAKGLREQVDVPAPAKPAADKPEPAPESVPPAPGNAVETKPPSPPPA
ncbi:MAG: PEGA domain-containing protein [Phycisphaeraceae bacterium]|nr:PEGA domain-containing protein [Phycisphaeraceae bacterium]